MAISNYWVDQPAEKPKIKPRSVVDLVFTTKGKQLPADHAWLMSEAIKHRLPWLKDEQNAGLHLIHGAQSGNGWQQPDDDGMIELSARTRFTLRLPKHRVDEAHERLSGYEINIDTHKILLLKSRIRPLSPLSTLLARHVLTPCIEKNEDEFLETVSKWLHKLSINPRKMLCGRIHQLTTPEKKFFTRSLLLADMTLQQSLDLQCNGIGPGRLMGCGVFMPHKSISAVHQVRNVDTEQD